jgi:HlyD family secretion protein
MQRLHNNKNINNHMKKALKILAGIIVLSIFVYTIYFLYQKSQAKPVVFETTNPMKAEIIKSTVATGSVKPRKEIMIKPKVSGIVEEVYVEAGDMIKNGDRIAKIKIIPDMVSLNNAQSRVNRARISYENAKLQYDREKDLLDQGVIARADFDNYDVTYKNAIEEVEAAENNLELIKEGQTKKGGEITNTVVVSTATGMVLDVPVEVGFSVIESNTFNDGTTIASVADMGDMIFEGKIDETEVGKIREGMPLILTVGAIDEQTFGAVLEHISPKGVEENGAVQFEIKANVTLKQNEFIRAGYSANAKIVLDRTPDSVMAIPESILQFEGDSSYVEIEVAPQKFEKRFIKTGLSDGINVEVKSGLAMEDKIKKPSGSLK